MRRLAALAVLAMLALPGQASALARSTTDRADDAAGKQIHVIYALPSDGVDRALDTNGTLANSVASFNTWLAGKAGGRSLRLDTFGGVLDVSFIRLPETNEQIRARDPYIRDYIEDRIALAGFTSPDKIYAVYYDGKSDWACGGGAWPPALPGNTAALYLDGFPDEPYACRNNPFAGPGGAPTYLEFAMLHEIMHTLGFVDVDAPNHDLAGHVSEDPNDLMWAGDGFWVPGGWGAVTLDTGNDDYYRHSNPAALDFDDSPFLTSGTGCVRWKGAVNGSWSDGTKWSTGSVPTSADEVCIDVAGTYVVTLTGAVQVAKLTLGGSSGTQTVSIQGGAAAAQLRAGTATLGARGAVALTSAGTAGSSTFRVDAASTTNNGRISALAGSGGARTIDLALDNKGTVEVTSGVALTALDPYKQTAGTTTLSAGSTLSLAPGGTLDLQGGTLGGAGTVGGNLANSAEVRPGGSPGILTVAGAYSQTKSGKLRIELNGPTAGTQHDRLHVTGAATLAGTLDLDSGFTPALGTKFVILEFASVSGKFKTVLDQAASADRGYFLDYNAADLTLDTRATADLLTTKSDSADPVAVGATFTYTITVQNLSAVNSATTVKVTDALKAPLVYHAGTATPSQGTCTAAGTPVKITCSLGTFAPGASATITFEVHSTAAGNIKNTASATSKLLDPNPANSKDTETTKVV